MSTAYPQPGLSANDPIDMMHPFPHNAAREMLALSLTKAQKPVLDRDGNVIC